MRSCILQVYIRLSSVDSHQWLFQLHISEREKREEEVGKKHGFVALISIQGSVFFSQEGKWVWVPAKSKRKAFYETFHK